MTQQRQLVEQIFTGNSEMARLMRSHDWSQTPLGSVENWTQSLRTIVSVLLNSRYPMFVFWGDKLIKLYNDGYRPILGSTKHPQALGKPGAEVWSEIWDTIGPMVKQVIHQGEATWSDNLLLFMQRSGYLEEVYFTFSYSPIHNETGGVGGLLCACTETTPQVLSNRRLQTLRSLASDASQAKTVEEACHIATRTLSANPYDIPFALLYLVEADGKQARLVSTAGIESGTAASPIQVNLTQRSARQFDGSWREERGFAQRGDSGSPRGMGGGPPHTTGFGGGSGCAKKVQAQMSTGRSSGCFEQAQDDAWGLSQICQTKQSEVVNDLATRFDALPSSAWDKVPTAASVMPIAQSGQPQLAGLLVLGISSRREFDDEYRGFFDLVASNVATAIANANAYEAERKRAEALAEIDRAKTAFFSNVSHEFRTPLALMLSPLEDLLSRSNGRLEPDDREQLQLVQRNGLRLQKLVDTLLNFSRLEAGRVQASYEATDLATYTAELASVFRSIIERAELELIIECPALPELVYVDREMWEKIVLNLISNAFKFTFVGRITVRLQAVDRWVELSITDTGVGIPKAELPHLFERFHRVDGTKSRTYEGSGIGLALVQELIKLHDGTIRVTSQVDCGTTFTIALPFGSAHLPQDRIQSTRSLDSTAIKAVSFVEEASRWLLDDNFELPILDFRLEGNANGLDSSLADQPRIQTPKSKILLADDNADMRDYVRRLLSLRFEVETVTNGVAALNAVQTNPPDLVLTDVMMPEMDGFDLLRSLRTNSATQEIPVILLSARAGEEARIEGLEAGADDYLIKPFAARELIARVEATLRLAQLRRNVREREQALQLETQTARTNLEQIVSSLRDGFVTFDRNWRYTYINDRQLEILKLPREAVMGKNVWDVFPDVVGTESYHQLHRAMNEHVELQFEFYYPMLNCWVEHRVYPISDGIAILVADVSDRKRIEATLRESEQRFRDMADHAPMMIWVTDPTGYCTYLSRSWYDFSGQTEATGLGFGWLDATHPDDRESSRTIFLAANDHQKAFQLEYRLRRKDGEYRTCIDAARPWFGAGGELKGYIGSVIDIDDRKQAEAALRRSEERYRTLFESIDEGFCVVEMLFDANSTPIDYRFLEINPVFEQQTGLRQAVGKTVRQLVPDLEDHWIKIYGQVALTGESVRFENCAEAMNRWFDVYACRTGQPEARKVAIVFKDISDRVSHEAEREQLLQREQTAREAAENVNRIKDEFLAVLSHELRSPLNPILGWSKLLQQGKLDAAKTTTALATIERNAKLQSQLIEDLLDISRILRGKLSLNVMPVDLSKVISAALETVRLAAEAKSLQIQIILSPGAGTVVGDAGRLQQVVWNLLSNAVKFTPQGGQITVTLTQIGAYAQFQVTDTGKGINPDFLPCVFDHFRQEDGATTRKFGGLGLGLAIVRQIVELHGGTVAVDSPGVEQGATFTVQIPLAPRLSELPSLEQSSASTSDLSGIHILVVDDDADSREFMAFVLEQANAIVTSVSSGLEAFQMIEQSVPDLVVSDIGMPEMDGYMLLQQIRALEQARQVPAIALTAYAGEFDRQQALTAGFQRHLAKPIEPDELVKAVETLMNEHYSCR